MNTAVPIAFSRVPNGARSSGCRRIETAPWELAVFDKQEAQRKGEQSRASQSSRTRAPAFTLIEVLLAIGIFSIVLISINTVFFAALRLRQKTSEMLDESAPLNHATAILRKDLQNAVWPGGVLAGDFRSSGPSGIRASGKGVASNLGGAQNGGLDFFTSTGTISDDEPWGDIQEVNYQLEEPLDRANATGRDLVRSVTRNLLATTSQMADVQRLMSNVENFDFSFFDGSQWRDTWDTTAGDTGLPAAVRIRIQLAPKNGQTVVNLQPMEMVVLIDTRSSTNQTQ